MISQINAKRARGNQSQELSNSKKKDLKVGLKKNKIRDKVDIGSRNKNNSRNGVSKSKISKVVELNSNNNYKLHSPVRTDTLYISSRFGEDRGSSLHNGLDIDGTAGDKIYAAKKGEVVFSGMTEQGGNEVVIKHKNGLMTKYSHLDSLNVAEGDKVSHKSIIGTMGSTGEVYTADDDGDIAHLHFEVIKDGKNINPEAFLDNEKMKYVKGDYGSGSCNTMSWDEFTLKAEIARQEQEIVRDLQEEHDMTEKEAYNYLKGVQGGNCSTTNNVNTDNEIDPTEPDNPFDKLEELQNTLSERCTTFRGYQDAYYAYKEEYYADDNPSLTEWNALDSYARKMINLSSKIYDAKQALDDYVGTGSCNGSGAIEIPALAQKIKEMGSEKAYNSLVPSNKPLSNSEIIEKIGEIIKNKLNPAVAEFNRIDREEFSPLLKGYKSGVFDESPQAIPTWEKLNSLAGNLKSATKSIYSVVREIRSWEGKLDDYDGTGSCSGSSSEVFDPASYISNKAIAIHKQGDNYDFGIGESPAQPYLDAIAKSEEAFYPLRQEFNQLASHLKTDINDLYPHTVDWSHIEEHKESLVSKANAMDDLLYDINWSEEQIRKLGGEVESSSLKLPEIADKIVNDDSYNLIEGIQNYTESSMSQDGIDFLKNFEKAPEQYRADDGEYAIIPYPDADGQSIGYGHLIKEGENFDGPITKEEAEYLLKKDLEWSANAVENLVTIDLTQNQKDALTSLVYNIGADKFSKSETRTKLNEGDFEGMATEWREFRMSEGKVLGGLEKRREDELDIFFNGDYTRNDNIEVGDVSHGEVPN
jgi:lysozyme